jgi:hypothetical protein
MYFIVCMPLLGAALSIMALSAIRAAVRVQNDLINQETDIIIAYEGLCPCLERQPSWKY